MKKKKTIKEKEKKRKKKKNIQLKKESFLSNSHEKDTINLLYPEEGELSKDEDEEKNKKCYFRKIYKRNKCLRFI